LSGGSQFSSDVTKVSKYRQVRRAVRRKKRFALDLIRLWRLDGLTKSPRNPGDTNQKGGLLGQGQKLGCRTIKKNGAPNGERRPYPHSCKKLPASVRGGALGGRWAVCHCRSRLRVKSSRASVG